MTLRVLLAIGCNEYEHESPLQGAEHDAASVFSALLRPELGDYDSSRSELLLSPTANQVRDAIRRALFSGPEIDTFSFFFAGHGAVESGSFYMLLKDTPSRGLSVGSLSLSDLFRAVNEAAPAQTNIFIDACEAGGLIADLGVLLKSELIGDAGTPGVTLVATAGQDESACETSAGGLGTTALLDVIEGRDPLNDTAAAFDLVEIGRRISTRLREERGQTPVVWGLNLYGPPRFCRNIRAGGDPTEPLRSVLQAWPPSSDVSIRKAFEDLWRVYAAVSEDWSPRSFAAVVDPILLSLSETPDAQAAVVERLAAACLERALISEDAFRPAQVGAALLTCLLPYIEAHPINHVGVGLTEQVGDALLAAALDLTAALDRDPYALLQRRSTGIPDLFLLPIRLANVLGWAGVAELLFDGDDPRKVEARELFAGLLRRILAHYSTSIVTISDAQASPFLVALAQASFLGMNEEAEELVGLLFSSLVACRANVARGDIPAASIFDFLEARAAGEYGANLGLLERPDEITAVVLRAGSIAGLDEVFDQDLWELDGHVFSAYSTDNYGEFGREVMSGGQNLVWIIGDTVFRISDLGEALGAVVVAPDGWLARAAVVLASLTYPDRVPWFLLEADPVSSQ